MTADPPLVVAAKDGRATLFREGDAAPSTLPGDPLLAVQQLLAPFAADPVPGLPPFQGGAAGYIGYDYGASLERLPRPLYDDLDIPDVVLGVYDWVIAWDHQTVPRVAHEHGAPRDCAGRTEQHGPVSARPPSGSGFALPLPPRRRLAGRRISTPGRTPARATRVSGSGPAGTPFDPTRTTAISRRSHVSANTSSRATSSRRICRSGWKPNTPAIRGRSTASCARSIPRPSPPIFEAPGLAVVSASPERFIQVAVGGAVETRPIKGTSPRGIGPEHDAHLGRALTESEKDRAENLMIVDLLRNDLSRVCVPGSVRVPELFALEHYSTVHHLVSTVVGHLGPEADAIGLLRAAFPGGSITGAPKVRAMEIIAELEPSRRGVYCGTVAYVEPDGSRRQQHRHSHVPRPARPRVFFGWRRHRRRLGPGSRISGNAR